MPLVISAAATSLTVTSSANPAPALSPVTFTLHLTRNGQSAGAGNALQLALGNGPQAVALTTDSSGSATYTTSALTPGTYPVVASFASTANLLASSAALTETITALPSTTSLTVAPNPAYLAQQVTLTAAVAASAPVGTGTITFFDGSTSLGTLSVTASGTATLALSTLATGTHPLSATFTPASTIFLASTSPVVSESILPSGFSIALQPSTITLVTGTTGKIAIQLASVGNFAGPLTLAYGTLPTYATASIAPSPVTLAAGGSAASTLTLNTLLQSAKAVPTKPGSKALPAVFAALLLCLLPIPASRRKGLRRLAASILLLLVLPSLGGCVNDSYTANDVAPGTYQLAVSATDVNHNTQTATPTVVTTPQP